MGPPSRKKLIWTSICSKLEEAKRRDHRKLGQELQLFTFVDEAPGFPLFYPKGIDTAQ